MESTSDSMPLLKLQLKKIFIDCKTFITSSDLKFHSDEEITKWYNSLCQHLAKLLNKLGEFHRESKEAKDSVWRGTIELYLNQLLTVLALLINIFLEESKSREVITEARKYTIKQVLWCLEGLENIVETGNIVVDPSGNFIKWMDAALVKMDLVNTKTNAEQRLRSYSEAKSAFEEVLCHAMSIAQVALPEDCNIIKGSSQIVLESLTSLQNELVKVEPNGAMVKLLKTVCKDKLCNLEERVNTAVLRLSLEVFSTYTLLLNQIHEFCLNVANKGKVDELESMVADFDLHVDRIMQIGLFAVSCSSETNYGVKIRSCLASLEALETELVPALSAVLSDNTHQSKQYASILKTHWQHQAKQLKMLVYHIIDPYAFCRVVKEKVEEQVIITSEDYMSERSIIVNTKLNKIVLYSGILKEFSTVALQLDINEFDKSQKDRLMKASKEFRAVLHEVVSAREYLMSPANLNLVHCMRVIKRCKILLTTINNLQDVLAEDSQDENIDITEEMPEVEPGFNNKFLEHIIKRGKLILNERSILYKTPVKRTSSKISETLHSRFISSRVTSRNSPQRMNFKKMNIPIDKKNGNIISFNIREILNDLTKSLSNSFTNE